MTPPTSLLAVARTRAARLSRRPPIEALEDRIAPAVMASISNSVLTINATADGDQVILVGDANNLFMHVKGTGGFDAMFLKTAFASVQFNDAAGSQELVIDYGSSAGLAPFAPAQTLAWTSAGGPSDKFSVVNLPSAPVFDTATLQLSNSSDYAGSVTIGTNVMTVSGVTGGFNFNHVPKLSMNPQAGPDRLQLDAAPGGAGQINGLTSFHLQRVTYLNTTNLTIDLGLADGANSIPDALNVAALAGTGLQNLTVNGGRGLDMLSLLPSLTSLALPTAGGAFTFDGGLDTNEIEVSSTVDVTLDAQNSRLSYAGAGSLAFQNTERFTLAGSTFTYLGAGSLTATDDVVLRPSAIDANAGGITVGATSIGYFGPVVINHVNSLTVNTPAGADDFTLQQSGSPATMLLSGTVGGGSFAHNISFTDARSVTLDTGSSDGANAVADKVTINQLGIVNGGNQSLIFKLGAGDDTIDFTQVGEFDLPVSGGGVSVDGGAGIDTLKQHAIGGYRLNSTQLLLVDDSVLNHTGVENFQLAGGPFEFTGSGTEGVVWVPSATSDETGRLDVTNSSIASVEFEGPLTLSHLASLELRPAAGADAFTLDAATVNSVAYATLNGTTGGSHPQSGRFTEVPALTIDLGANDATGAADTITIRSLTGESALSSLSLKTGDGDDVITFASSVPSLTLPASSDGPDLDAGPGTDQVVVNAPGHDLELSKPGAVSILSYDGMSTLTFSGVERFDLTAQRLGLAGTDAETVDWMPGYDAVLNTALGAQAGSLAAPGSFFGSAVYHLDPSDNAPLTINHVHALNLTTQGGADTFTLEAGPGNGNVTLSGTAGADAHGAILSSIAIVGVDLGANDSVSTADRLTVNSLAAAGLITLTVKTGNGDDTLELGSGLTSLQLGVQADEGFSFDGGTGSDTMEVTSSSPIVFSPYLLQLGNTGGVQYQSVEHFILDAGVNGEVAYSGDRTEDFLWSPDAALTQHGTAAFAGKDLTYTGMLAIGWLNSLTLTTPAGDDAFALGYSSLTGSIDGTVAGATAHHAIFTAIPTITFDLGANDGTTATPDTLTIDSLEASELANFTLKTGAGNDRLTLPQALTNLKNSAWDAGAGNDTLVATADVSMALGAGLLSYTDNASHTSDFGHLTLTGSAVEVAHLTGGASANLFRFNGWAQTATVKGGDGNDTFDVSGGFSGAGSFAGEGDDDTFILQADAATTGTRSFGGVTGSLTFDGGPGANVLTAQANLDFMLTDGVVTRWIPKTKTTPAQSVATTLIGIGHAILGGGASTNLLFAQAFTGVADLSGEGGVDNLVGSEGGGHLYGFHAGATAAEMKTKLYTRDNFFASPGSTTDHLHATTKAGNILSFRYSPTAVTYTIPNAAGGTVNVGGGLSIELTEGMITAVEGSVFGDHLTGNNKTNFLIGGKGNDVLKAVGFDYLYGGPGRDTLLGVTPFKFGNTNYPIPNSTGVPSV